MKKLFKNILIVCLLISFKALAQTPNIGFENGTFSNWQCYTGDIDSLGNITVSPTPPIYNRHTIMSNQGGLLDPYGQFPMLCPNGSNYSVKLGNDDIGAQAERVTYTFKVPAISQYSIIFNYAVVLENPSHLPFQQPKFTAQIFNVTDNKYIDCPSFDFVSSSALPGFKLSQVAGHRNAQIYYKDWSTATIDLHNYSGKTLRLEFTTNDCTLGGHFGYAYLDVNEGSNNAIAGNAYCLGQKSITLFGPNGFASYNWFNANNLTKQIGTGQSFTISPPPPDLSSYAVVISPYLGLGCVDTLYTVINKIDEGFKLKVPDTIHACTGGSVDLTAAKITAGSSPGMTLSYFNDSLATSYLYNPKNITVAGVYYIQGVNAAGCMNLLPVNILFNSPVINVTNPQPVVFPTPVDLSKTYTPQPHQIYNYYTNAEATSPLINYKAVKFGGTYYIKTTDTNGCDKVVPVNVVVTPPPPYSVTAPNIFTPNNDGINDLFSVTLSGVADFDNLKIYNRYGQLVFTAKSQNEYWDGTYNGRNVPGGTYYWVLTGTDEYYNTTFTKAASITLVR